jgi:molecular chaperone DnaK
MIHATTKGMADVGDKLSADEKEKIDAAIAALKEAVKGEDQADIEAKTNALSETSAKIYEHLQAQGQQEGTAENEPQSASAKPDDNVVDAEFEEVKDKQ